MQICQRDNFKNRKETPLNVSQRTGVMTALRN